MNLSSKIFDYIIDFLAYIGGAICIFMMLGVSADVIGRYFLIKPIPGMVEANEIMIIWIIFLGSPWVLKKGRHITMDAVLLLLRPRAQAMLNMITHIICAAISLGLCWYGVKVMLDLFQRGTMEVGNLTINSGYVILAIPLGCLLLFIQFLRVAYGYRRKFKIPVTGGSQSKGLVTEKMEGR